MPGIHSVTVCGHRHQERFLPQIFQFLHYAESCRLAIYIESQFYDYLASTAPEGEALPKSAIRFESIESLTAAGIAAPDVAVSFGGDGTLLRTARHIGVCGIPLLGINTGHLGFLAHHTIEQSCLLLDLLRSGKYDVEERTLLRVICDGIPGGISPYALNEVAIMKDDTSSMIRINMEVNGSYLTDYKVDGLIVSTSTGSTAYNLSVGGPIMQPGLDCMILSPVAPHSLSLRPIVLAGNSHLKAVTSSRTPHFRVSLDGNSFLLPAQTPVHIEKAAGAVQFVSFPGESFAEVLRAKLNWG